jgi:hypothetical protein
MKEHSDTEEGNDAKKSLLSGGKLFHGVSHNFMLL